MEIFKVFFQPLVIAIGLMIGLYQYGRQQKFKRLQNLSLLWKGFTDNEQILTFFNLMNEIENGNGTMTTQLENYDTNTKLKYMALLEEVSLYVAEFEVDKEYAKYLFQWHFYFPYQSVCTSAAFWKNIGGAEEMNASYWQHSHQLSSAFKP